MNLDLRIPMGMMFTLTGLILTFYGLLTHGDASLYARCLGFDVNLWWGLVLLAFGLTMLVLGRRAELRLQKSPPPPPEEGEVRRGH